MFETRNVRQAFRKGPINQRFDDRFFVKQRSEFVANTRRRQSLSRNLTACPFCKIFLLLIHLKKPAYLPFVRNVL